METEGKLQKRFRSQGSPAGSHLLVSRSGGLPGRARGIQSDRRRPVYPKTTQNHWKTNGNLSESIAKDFLVRKVSRRPFLCNSTNERLLKGKWKKRLRSQRSPARDCTFQPSLQLSHVEVSPLEGLYKPRKRRLNGL